MDPPPFATTLNGPGAVTLSASSGTPIVVDRAQGITFSWTPTAGDYVRASIGTMWDPAVLCSWPMTNGQGTFPASLLEGLAPGTTLLSVESGSQVEQTRAKWSFVVTVSLQTDTQEVTLQ